MVLAICTNKDKLYIDSTMATNLEQCKYENIHKLLLITDIKTLIHTYVYQLYCFCMFSRTIRDVYIRRILRKNDWQGIVTVFVLECIFQSVSKILCYPCLRNVSIFIRLMNNYIAQLFILNMYVEIYNK